MIGSCRVELAGLMERNMKRIRKEKRENVPLIHNTGIKVT